MSIDLPSITAFALEGSGAAALALGPDHTLTLQPQGGERGTRSLGTVKVGATRDAKPAMLRAAVVPGTSPGLTLTF
jgi:hypothetical protein